MARGLKVKFFDVLDDGEAGACREVQLESFDALSVSFGQRFDAPIRQIAHVAQNLMAGGGTLRKEAIADALHFPANQKFPRDFHPLKTLCSKTRKPITKNATENSIEQRAVGSRQQEVGSGQQAVSS